MRENERRVAHRLTDPLSRQEAQCQDSSRSLSVRVPGLVHLHTGKVRDLYRNEAGELVLVATDRISAYDWVLPTEIPDKGRILTRLSLWWFDQLADLVPGHLVSTDVPEGAPADGRAG